MSQKFDFYMCGNGELRNVYQLGCDCNSRLGAVQFNSTPDTPEEWSCQDWMFWHQELVKAFMNGSFQSRVKYPKAEAIRLANRVFMEWWNKNVGFFDGSQFCGYESDFLSYFKSVGLTDHISFVAGIVTPITSGAAEVSESAVESVKNTADAIQKTTKTASWLLPVALIALTVGGGYLLYQRNRPESNK